MKEKISEDFKEVKEEFEEYISTRVDLIKLQSAENLSRFLSGMIVKIVLFSLFCFVLLFLSVGFAFWLGRELASQSLGFIIVGALYLLIGLIFWVFRRLIVEKPIIKSFVQLFFPIHNDYD